MYTLLLSAGQLYHPDASVCTCIHMPPSSICKHPYTSIRFIKASNCKYSTYDFGRSPRGLGTPSEGPPPSPWSPGPSAEEPEGGRSQPLGPLPPPPPRGPGGEGSEIKCYPRSLIQMRSENGNEMNPQKQIRFVFHQVFLLSKT